MTALDVRDAPVTGLGSGDRDSAIAHLLAETLGAVNGCGSAYSAGNFNDILLRAVLEQIAHGRGALLTFIDEVRANVGVISGRGLHRYGGLPK